MRPELPSSVRRRRCARARSYLKVERLVDFAEPALAQQIEEKVAVVQYWVRAEAGVVLVADSLQLPEVELLVEEKIAVLFLEVGFLLFSVGGCRERFVVSRNRTASRLQRTFFKPCSLRRKISSWCEVSSLSASFSLSASLSRLGLVVLAADITRNSARPHAPINIDHELGGKEGNLRHLWISSSSSFVLRWPPSPVRWRPSSFSTIETRCPLATSRGTRSTNSCRANILRRQSLSSPHPTKWLVGPCARRERTFPRSVAQAEYNPA